MPAIRFGFILPAYQFDSSNPAAYVATVDRALNLIDGVFDSFWIIDHLQFGETAVLESFTTLAFMAARHPRLNFGHTVICQSFRNPGLLAKTAATLQFLSGGRFTLGIGAGWHEEEYRAYGYDFPPPAMRVEQLEETLQILQLMWSGEPATFQGRHYQVSAARRVPAPAPPPPVMVGAFRPKMLHLAARHAAEWNVSSTGLRKYARLAGEFDQACTAVGRDPAAVRRSWGGGCICAPTREKALQIAGDRYDSDPDGDDFDFVGTPADLVEQMRGFINLGVTGFMLDCGGFPDLTTLELLAGEVIPALRK